MMRVAGPQTVWQGVKTVCAAGKSFRQPANRSGSQQIAPAAGKSFRKPANRSGSLQIVPAASKSLRRLANRSGG